MLFGENLMAALITLPDYRSEIQTAPAEAPETHIAVFSNLPKEEALKIAESFQPVETVEITLPR